MQRLLNPGLRQVTKYIGLDVHKHPIARSSRTTPWYCDVCKRSGRGDRYRCQTGCDFDMCGDCWKTKAKRAGGPRTEPVDSVNLLGAGPHNMDYPPKIWP